jgi:hypothetical protein
MADLIDEPYVEGGNNGWWKDNQEQCSEPMNAVCNVVCLILILIIAYLVYKKYLCKKEGMFEGGPNVPYSTGTLRMGIRDIVGTNGESYETQKMAQDGHRQGMQGEMSSGPRLYGNKSNNALADSLFSGN